MSRFSFCFFRSTVLMVCLLCLGISINHSSAADWWPFPNKDSKDGKVDDQKGSSPQTVKVDDTPVNRDATAPIINSFSPTVKKVTPSVVSIFTMTTIHPTIQGNGPLMNDPFFRQFFGDQGGQDGGGNHGANPKQFNLPAQHQAALGSGVIVTADGYILTNNHVIDAADQIRVRLSNDRRDYVAKIVGKDPYTDVALIKIDANNLTPMVLADSDKVEVGDVVLAVGNPLGLDQTVTMGIVSALGRREIEGMSNKMYEDFIQTDAAINHGNSGGPLVDVQGRMIGLNAAIVSEHDEGNIGIALAIPSNLVRYVMDSIFKNGQVIRGYLGVKIQDVNSQLAEAYKLPEIAGAIVTEVEPTGPAAQAGFRPEDIVLEFNGKKVDDSSALHLLVAQTPPKTKAQVKVWREGKEIELDVVLAVLPTEDAADASGKQGSQNDDQSGENDTAIHTLVDGVKIDDLTPDIKRQLNPPPDLKGCVVTGIDQDSPAGQPGSSGLQVGDIIVAIEHQPITSVKDAVDVAKANSNKKSLLLRVWANHSYHFVVLSR